MAMDFPESREIAFLNMLSRIEADPSSATREEIARLTRIARRTPSNLLVRYGATRFLHTLRNPIDAVATATFVEGIFYNAQQALTALKKVSDHNPNSVNQAKLAAAMRRQDKISAIEPFALTKWLHKIYPNLSVSRYHHVIGQPPDYDLIIKGLRMTADELTDAYNLARRLKAAPATGTRAEHDTLISAMAQRPGPWARLWDFSRLGVWVQKRRIRSEDIGNSGSEIRLKMFATNEVKKAIQEILNQPKDAINEFDRADLAVALEREERLENSRTMRFVKRRQVKAIPRLTKLGIGA